MAIKITPADREVVEKARLEADQETNKRRTSPSATRAAERRVAIDRKRSGLRRFLQDNGLSLAAFLFFIVSFAGQVFAGEREYNDERRDHGQPAVTMTRYLSSGAFIEATAENWESEFLQMGVFVLLTAYLYQRGSSESKTIEEPDAVDQDPREARDDSDAPWPVRRGGLWLTVYKNSLGGALLLLFVGSFIAHAIGGSMAYTKTSSNTAEQPSPRSAIFLRASSGSSHSRTGKVSSSRWRCSF